MSRLCKILVPIKEQKAEMAMRCVLQLTSLEPKPKAVRVFPLRAGQKELCIEFLLHAVNTEHEAEEAVKKIWFDYIRDALKKFRHQEILIII